MTGWLRSVQIPASRRMSMCHLLTTAMNSLCKKQERGASTAWASEKKRRQNQTSTRRHADGPSQSRRHHFGKSTGSGVPSTVYLTLRKYRGTGFSAWCEVATATMASASTVIRSADHWQKVLPWLSSPSFEPSATPTLLPSWP